MGYTELFFSLKLALSNQAGTIKCGDNIEIERIPFNSESHWFPVIDEYMPGQNDQLGLGVADSAYFENNHFQYLVFRPTQRMNTNKAIIMLHGLNERIWDKYLPWAYELASSSGIPVILFPIAFHVNRAPAAWSNPKKMAMLIDSRKKTYNPQSLTFANVALSTRLTEQPLRFLKSGLQTIEDILLLCKQLEDGLIPGFSKGTRADFFSYSIGAFITQILLLAYPMKFPDSRIFLFCGGSAFADMNGVSRLIMDSTAFDAITHYYVTEMHETLKNNKLLNSLFDEFPVGKAFFAMLKEDNQKKEREEIFGNMTQRMMMITLKKDSVIPSSGCRKLFGASGRDNIFELDFPHDYCHEMPFPVSGKIDHRLIDDSFTRIFSAASAFFSEKTGTIPKDLYSAADQKMENFSTHS